MLLKTDAVHGMHGMAMKFQFKQLQPLRSYYNNFSSGAVL
jgi:hypothetical protein